MAYTYNQPKDGVFEPADEVRFILQDTVPKAPFSLSDEEIQFLLAREGGVVPAAAQAARRMSTLYRKSAVKSKSIGNLSLSYDYDAAAGEYEALGKELTAEGTDGDAPSGPIFAPSPAMFCQGQFDNGGGSW